VANIASALKRMRQSERRRTRNMAVGAAGRAPRQAAPAAKSARAALDTGSVADARVALSRTVKTLDKAVTKGVLPRNTAARRKSRLARQLNALARAQK
jgi:small subunit ribosomal protein S20